MCMIINHEATKRLREQLDEEGFIWCYKVVVKNRQLRTLNGYYQLESPFQGDVWRSGVRQSTRHSTRLKPKEQSRNIVLLGFHLFLAREGAEAYMPDGRTEIIKVKCRKSDFVRAGTFSVYNPELSHYGVAVFTKVEVPRREHRKAIKPTRLMSMQKQARRVLMEAYGAKQCV